MLSRRTILQSSLAGGMVAGLAGLAAFANLYPLPDRDEETTGWRRIAWPFPRDAFPAGRAWKRDDTEVYVRPKLGFCGNCDTGVVEDSEVDRVTDIDLLDERFVPLGEGKRIQLTDLDGSRATLSHHRKADASASPRELRLLTNATSWSPSSSAPSPTTRSSGTHTGSSKRTRCRSGSTPFWKRR